MVANTGGRVAGSAGVGSIRLEPAGVEIADEPCVSQAHAGILDLKERTMIPERQRWSADARAFAERISRAGFDPFNPSAECQLELARPRGLGHLDWVDAAGVQSHLLTLKLLRRFARAAEYTDERGHFVVTLAGIHLMVEIRPPAEWTREELYGLLQQNHDWRHGRCADAARRMDEDVRTIGADEVSRLRERYEPAFTLRVEQHALGIDDTAGDLKRMARAIAMHDEGLKRPRNVQRITIDTLIAYFELATQGGGMVSRFNREGKLVLKPLKVKTALDKASIRTNPQVREVPATDLGNDQGDASAFSTERFENPDAQQANLLGAISAIVARRRAASQPGSLRAVVLDEFASLAADEGAAARIAVANGVSARAVRKVFQKEREIVRRLLSA
jgi:hypothetical protein